MDYEAATAFPFTESRLEDAMRAVQKDRVSIDSSGRRWWRDEGSPHGLRVLVSKRGGTFYRVHKEAGKVRKVRIGDATTMRVSKARGIALKLAGGQRDAAPPPIRVRTDGITVAAAWAAYVEDVRSGDYVAGKKPLAASTLRSYVELFEPHVGRHYGEKSLHFLARKVPDIHRGLKDRPATGNRLLQVLKNLFTHAAINGNWDGPNPTIDPITGKVLRKYSVESRERHLTTAEAARLLQVVAGECDPWCDFWPLLLLTGVRLSTLRQMKWAQLDLRSESTWAVPTTKNGDPQLVPITGAAADILQKRLERTPKAGGKPESVYVFPRKGKPAECLADADHAWARVVRKAELENVRIHDLRRTAGSWATQGGAPLPAVGKMLGHRSHNSTAVYARADISAARNAAEIVAARLTEARAVQ